MLLSAFFRNFAPKIKRIINLEWKIGVDYRRGCDSAADASMACHSRRWCAHVYRMLDCHQGALADSRKQVCDRLNRIWQYKPPWWKPSRWLLTRRRGCVFSSNPFLYSLLQLQELWRLHISHVFLQHLLSVGKRVFIAREFVVHLRAVDGSAAYLTLALHAKAVAHLGHYRGNHGIE